jgi:hypothetical protein
MGEERPTNSMSSTPSVPESNVLSGLEAILPIPPELGSNAWSTFTNPPTSGIDFEKITSTPDLPRTLIPPTPIPPTTILPTPVSPTPLPPTPSPPTL